MFSASCDTCMYAYTRSQVRSQEFAADGANLSPGGRHRRRQKKFLPPRPTYTKRRRKIFGRPFFTPFSYFSFSNHSYLPLHALSSELPQIQLGANLGSWEGFAPPPQPPWLRACSSLRSQRLNLSARKFHMVHNAHSHPLTTQVPWLRRTML
jgi:hypothetical protein